MLSVASRLTCNVRRLPDTEPTDGVKGGTVRIVAAKRDDRDMGDPAFFEKAVKDWLVGLDDAAQAIGKTTAADDATLESRFGKYLADWSDFHLALDVRRAAWLEQKLFEE